MEEIIKKIKNFIKALKEEDQASLDIQKIEKFINQRVKEEEDKKEKADKKAIVMDIQNYLNNLNLCQPLNDMIVRVKSFVDSQIEGIK